VYCDANGKVWTNSEVTSSVLPTGAATSASQTDGTQVSRIVSKTGDSTYQSPRLDAITHVLEVIDYAHHEIHAGSSFTVSDTVACNTTTVKWMIITPNSTTYAHLVFHLAATGEATFLVKGDADRTAGTALACQNRRRVGTPAASTVTVSRTPTGGTTDGATTLFSIRDGVTGVGGKSVQAGEGRESQEWILKPNTKYVVSITTYADVFATMKLDWYEHADRTA
jgi:hypothetical protein